MDISIFGLGYVGTVCAGCLAAEGHTVIGVDVTESKVSSMNSGVAPLVEPKLGDLVAEAHAEGRVSATTSAADAVHASEISLVCVGTPSRANGSLDLTYMKRVSEDIGRALATKDGPHLVVFRSTMLPGTTEDVLIPILESSSGKEAGVDFHVCYNPEFLREGSSVDDFFDPPKIVVGESAPGRGDPLMALYDGIEAPRLRVSIRVAEMAKYCDNAFHALKVTFANEVGRVCRELGMDSHDVMDVFCQDRKLNLSEAYLKPGFSFGGSCLPKDLRALTYQAKRLDVPTPMLSAILPSNTAHTQRGIQRIMEKGRKRIGFLGMAFKPGTDDLRESPLVEIVETLLGKGYDIRIFDRSVSASRLIGQNRRFIEEKIPHLSALLVETMDEVVEHAEVLVVGYRTPEFLETVEGLGPDTVVLDLARLAPSVETEAEYEGICW